MRGESARGRSTAARSRFDPRAGSTWGRWSAPARAAVAAALLLAASTAAAQSCRSLAATNMVFTNYTPFGPGVAATTTITYSCPPPIDAAWISISAPRTMTAGGNALAFDLYQDPNHTAVWTSTPPVVVRASKNGSVTVYGFLPGGQNAPAGTYAAALTVSIYTWNTGNLTDTATLNVSTSGFVPTCTIGAGTVAFGAYDPLGVNATNPLDAQGSFQVACTRNTPYTVGLGLGSNAAGTTRRMANGAQRLQYELYTSASRTAVWSTATTVGGTAASISPITLTVYGRVPAGQNVAAGTYSDTVLETINF